MLFPVIEKYPLIKGCISGLSRSREKSENKKKEDIEERERGERNK